MKNTLICAAALTLVLLDIGGAPAWAQATTPPPAAPPAAAPAAPPTSPVSTPSYSPTLTPNVKPLKIDTGLFGDAYVTGVVSGMAQWENNAFPGDRLDQLDITNGQIFVQKVDGLVQYFIQAGAYSLPDLGAPYIRAGKATGAFYGALPQWYIKLAPNDSFSVQAGNLPTLVGAESTFTYQNVNIERGLLWNQENAVNRGIQANYTRGPLALSFAWTDGFFSNRYSWLSGSATYTIDPANSVAFIGGGSVNTETVSTTATPLLQNNETIYNLYYTHTSGPWTLVPAVQYTSVPSDSQLGTTHSLNTFGVAMYATYAFDGGYSLAGRAEYISSNGNTGDPTLLYGPGSNAWSLTVTPTYQNKMFFARGEFSYVKATSSTAGFAFGPTGTNTSQTRLLIETGVLF
jgi:Putative beta-barrel porin-2, OmpL-like. bbp2